MNTPSPASAPTSPRTRTAGKRTQAVDAVLRHIRTPLYSNGYALMLAAGAVSVLGMLYWVLAAHYYSTESVGLNSAALSAMMFVTGITQLNLTSVLVRFLPRAGRGAPSLIAAAYLMAAVAGAAGAVLFLLGLPLWSPSLRYLTATPFGGALFVLGTVSWSIFALQDSVLTGLHEARWVPLENVLWAVLKILLLVVFAAGISRYGIFLSWVLPACAGILPVNLLVLKRLLPHHIETTCRQAEVITRRNLVRFTAANYLASVFTQASTMLLPVVVLSQAGARASAYFYSAWLIAYSLQLMALNATSALTAQASRYPELLMQYAHKSLVNMMWLLGGPALILLIGSPYVLRFFGGTYAQHGSASLRLLVLGSLLSIVLVTYMSVLRVQQRNRVVVLVQGTICLLTLSLSALLIGPCGILGVGIAYALSQATVLAAIAVLDFSSLHGMLTGQEQAERLRAA